VLESTDIQPVVSGIIPNRFGRTTRQAENIRFETFHFLCMAIQAIQTPVFGRYIQIALCILCHLSEQEPPQAFRIIRRNTVEQVILCIRIKITQAAVIGPNPHSSLVIPVDIING